MARNQEFKVRNDSSLHRKAAGIRNLRDKILIVCEGEKTEPNYFRAFPIKREVVEVRIEGTGYNTTSLVREALRLKEKAKRQGNEFNQVWCVFDRDSFTPQSFNQAIDIANDNGIRIAYSIEAFELWYLLHFHYYDSALSRNQYKKKLTGLLKRKYKKNDADMYAELKNKQNSAIQNAKKLIKNSTGSPAGNNPSTTVYKLVEALNRFING